jgi:hypothetical protein
MVVFLDGDTDYAEKKMVFKRQADYRIGRVEKDSSLRAYETMMMCYRWSAITAASRLRSDLWPPALCWG